MVWLRKVEIVSGSSLCVIAEPLYGVDGNQQE